jgi:hypothetical protein
VVIHLVDTVSFSVRYKFFAINPDFSMLCLNFDRIMFSSQLTPFCCSSRLLLRLQSAIESLCFAVALAFFVTYSVSLGDEPYSPEHPDVQVMVKKAVDFLGSGFNRQYPSHEYDILMGYTAYKATDDQGHPLVKIAIPLALKTVREVGQKTDAVRPQHLLYDVSVSAMLLAAVDGAKYKKELEQLRDFLVSVQRPTGAFGYLNSYPNAGDASQTQYVTLALWSMKQAKVELDMRSVEKVSLWLQNAQRPDGGWIYQTPSDGEPTHQMLAAGLSAALISADILDVMRGPGVRMENPLAGEDSEEEEEIPKVFRRVSADEIAGKKEKRFVAKAVTRESIKKVAAKAASWLAENPYKRGGTSEWFYYWIYSQERYESFLEILNGRREKNPEWYRQGVETLKKYQHPDTGAFGTVEGSLDVGGVEVATCLSILYLLRTTQKAIGELKEGSNIGGYGLGDISSVGVINGKVVDKSQVTSIEDALSLLETNKEGSVEDTALSSRIVLDADPAKRKAQLSRFARMLGAGNSWSARRLGAKILGRGDDLDFVPDLIFALGDGDQVVQRTAEASLKILSRKMGVNYLPTEGPITADHRVKAERAWKEWYLSVRPGHIFADSQN